jgi:hypothetical protein
MKDSSSGLPPATYPPENILILHRLVRIKRNMRIGLPQNLTALKRRLSESDLGGKNGDLNDYDLFYTIGIIFSNSPEPITMGELSHALQVP